MNAQSNNFAGGLRSRSSKLMASITVAATVTGLLYYSAALCGMLSGARHRPPKPSEEQFVQLKPGELRSAPWTKARWNCAKWNATLTIDRDDLEPVIRLDGLESGGINLRLTGVNADGNTYRADAYCVEHGGRVTSKAELHRLANNQLRLRLRYNSEITGDLDLFFERMKD